MFILAEKKRCSKCGEINSLDDFRKDRNRKDGLYPWCKACHNADCAKYRKNNPHKRRETIRNYYHKHVDEIREKSRQWFIDNKDKASGYFAKWRKNNKEKALSRTRVWREENKDKVALQNKKWSTENPDRRRDISRKRRALKNEARGNVTTKEIKELFRHYNYTCLCCGRGEPEIKLTHDHIVPLSRGGENTIENSQPLCLSCNSKKGTKAIDYR